MSKSKQPVVKILVCCHKPGAIPSDEIYLPIHCGKSRSEQNLGIQGDDTGENISAKNPNYCELTALYWAWKNLPETDYIGLCHYRRFFNLERSIFPQRDVLCVKTLEANAVNTTAVSKILNNHDIILPKRVSFPYSNETQYCLRHIADDLAVLRSVLAEKYPEYLPAYDAVMKNSNKLSSYNMFITRKVLFDDYCKWLFDLLFAVETKIHISEYPYQQRVFGFMGERLLNIYCHHHDCKIVRSQVCFIDEQGGNRGVVYWLRHIYVNLLYRLNSVRLFHR